MFFRHVTKGIRIMPNRFNIYSLIHKYARAEIGRAVEQSGATDFEIFSQKENFLSTFSDLVGFLNDHAKREEKYIHPLLKQCKSNLLEGVESEHARLDKQLNELVIKAPKLTGKFSYPFYLDFSLFQSAYLLHLNYEERELLPELHQNFSDEALMQAHKEMMDTMPNADLIKITRGMLPVITHTERCEIFSIMQSSMPEAVFNKMCELASDSLEDAHSSLLFEEIGCVNKTERAFS
jgi:hemerythrin-like domain-containing protein